jgi:hypothetical protein
VDVEGKGVRWFVRIAGVTYEFDTEDEATDFVNEMVDEWCANG